MSENFVAITYVGKLPGFKVTCGDKTYDFEWRKAQGVGTRADEVNPRDLERLSKMRDRRGKKLFLLEKNSDII